MIVFCSAAAGFLGFYLGQGSNEVPVSQSEGEPQVKVVYKDRPVEAQVNSDMDEAQKLYGKAFQLFLANLGLNLDKTKKETLKRVLENPKEYLATTKENSGETEVYIPRELDFAPTGFFKEFVQNEKAELKNITDDKLLDEAQKFILKDPKMFYARSNFINEYNEIKTFNGTYQATLFYIAGKNKGRNDQIELTVDFKIKDENEIDGSFDMKISSEGKTYSHARGTGGNGDIRVRNGQIIVEASPDTFFHFQDNKMGISNFYRRGKLVGMARFIRN